ncbi:MAG: aminotransferase class I/II-fold pyridoxal phosphate-dependent enzyme [Planctomycetota bacterium]|nr:aminotransferase class I/II-fold pyridoxal phosphate-dependent enzyme [Planctomycetota bacterium]
MSDEVDALCARPHRVPELVTRPIAAPIFPATVFACDSPAQASQLLAGQTEGFVYSRDGHPNALMLAERCAELHGAQQAIVTGSGMGALGLALLSLLEQGDHIVASRQLYGRSIALFSSEASRLGIETSLVDTCDLQSTADAMTDRTRLLVTETIANPMLRVADIAALAELAGKHQAKLLVDNTFASPAICQPLAWGADLVMESITKIMNGHSDVMLGLLCGRTEAWQRVPMVHTTWGLFASPMDCWLAARGLSTLGLRAAKASENAAAVATMLSKPTVLSRYRDLVQVSYPGLTSHPDHQLAARQFGDRYGNVVTFTLRGGRPVAERFIAAAADRIPFCPSLGELFTTLSHPASTSHRGLTPTERLTLGIEDGTIRLSVGCEPVAGILQSLDDAIQAAVA